MVGDCHLDDYDLPGHARMYTHRRTCMSYLSYRHAES